MPLTPSSLPGDCLLRKLAAAVLALPVLATLYVPILLRRSIAIRLVLGLGLVALLGLGAFAVLSPRSIAAKAPTVSAPLDSASFSQTVDAVHRLHDPVRLGFSSPMNTASVVAALTIDPVTPVNTSWDTAGKTLTISPRGMWQPATFYTVKVASTALDAAGQPLGQAARALFNTRAPTTAHLVLSQPIAGGASTATGFTVSFDRAVPTPSADSLLSISPPVTGTLTDVSTTADGTSITFQPDQPLASGTAYTIAVQSGIVDADGSSVAVPLPLRITTAVAPGIVRFRPLNKTANVATTQLLSVRFTQAMNPATTSPAFKAAIGTKVLAGKVRWAEKNTVLVFTPSTPLARGSIVTMSVSTSATSAGGVPLAVARSVSFSTVPRAAAAKVTPPKTRPVSGGSGGGTVGAGSWHAVEVYYFHLMNCTRGGGWILASGRCDHPGGSGVAPLILNAGISNKVSRPYAKYLTVRGICTHFAQGTPGDRLHKAGYPGDYRENIGCADVRNPYKSVLMTHLYFQSEKPCGNYCHWANIMDPRVNQVGIGVWVIGNRVRLVVDFWKG
jgi:hypothetical protein